MNLKQIIVTVTAMLFLAATGISAQTIWDGTTNTDWYGDGSADTFYISTAEELAGFAELTNVGTTFANKIVKLTADILLNDTTGWGARVTDAYWTDKVGSPAGTKDSLVLAEFNTVSGTFRQWTPISDNQQFTGTFDGAGHTVSGLYIDGNIRYAGLFGYTAYDVIAGNSSIIKNVHIKTSFVKTGNTAENTYAGGVVGRSNSSIDSCSSGATVSSSSSGSSSYSGSLAGYAYYAVFNSSATGDVSSYTSSFSYSAYSGGLIGYASSNYSSVYNCYATGNVYAAANARSYCGGLVGFASSLISNSYAVGGVSSSADYSSGGGLVGYTNNASIYNSYATGNVSSASINDTSFSGGLVGKAHELIMKNSYALGNAESVRGTARVGGLIAYIANNNSKTDNCYSAGSVSFTNGDGTSRIGASIGQYNNGGTITNVYYNKTENDGIDSIGAGHPGDGVITGINEEIMKSADFTATLTANTVSANAAEPTPNPLYRKWGQQSGIQGDYPFHGIPVTMTTDVSVKNKTYDGTVKASLDLSSVIIEGIENDADVHVSIGSVNAVFTDKNIGVEKSVILSGTFSLSGTDANDYMLIQPNITSLKANITAKPLSVSWGDTVFTYSGQKQIPSANVNTDITGETVMLSVLGGATNVKSDLYTATATMAEPKNTNYRLVDTTQDFSIVKKELTVTLSPKIYNMEIHETVPTFVPSFSGFVNDETADVLGGALVVGGYDTTNIANYSLTLSGLTANNYAIGYDEIGLMLIVTKISLSDDMLSPVSAQTYTGSQITPLVVVSHNSKTLVEDTDYTLAYGDNVAVGTDAGSIMISGIGDYTGVKVITFDIVKDESPITKPQKSDSRFGIRFANSIVSGKAEISVVLPNNERATQTKIVVYDAIGNVVYEFSNNGNAGKGFKGRPASPLTVWNLTNSAGRTVANGTYLVIAEVKSQSGMSYHYSAKLGVKR